MNDLRHQRIIANAGSGKTYRLTSRYLDLLARGEPAERIVALTFTRKAAGEFLERIFARLAGDDHPDNRRLLRELIEKLPQLTLATLDSFIGRIVRAFPFECGLAGEVAILDEHSRQEVRGEVLDAIFREHAANDAHFEDFLELVRRQSRNAEGREVTAALDDEIAALHESYLVTPPGIRWGDPRRIWPSGTPLLDEEDLAGLTDEFARELADCPEPMDDAYASHWDGLLASLRALRDGMAVPEALQKFAVGTLDPKPAKTPGRFLLKISRRSFSFRNECRDRVAALGRAILRVELNGRLARSQALHELVARFERAYQSRVRSTGRVTFSDLTGMLAAAAGASWGGRSPHAFSREEMDYRLDARYDHWLLDEFQDTSRLQWFALRNLIDEVVQSDSGRRTFFYVGDTKQAIYTWRGGDPRLFDEIADFYNASGTGRIDVTESLAISRRSAPEILDAVNALFAPENLTALQEDFDFPGEVIARWSAAWRRHEPWSELPPGGYVGWRTIPSERGGRTEALDAAAADWIAEINPCAKGYSCAVLVQRNARIGPLIDALRSRGIDASSEGRSFPCVDNGVGAGLLAVLQGVAHPADSLARAHAAMTPLGGLVGDNFHTFRLQALETIAARGFAGAFREWIDRLSPPAGSFAASRAADCLRAAAAFDETGSGLIDDFFRFAATWTTSDPPSAGAVRVLTVHAAKGLDFDMVVLPDLDGHTLVHRRRDAPVYLDGLRDGHVRWGLELPPAAICATDDTLRAAALDVLVEDTYESLCCNYVAMTRAKRGLYLVTTALAASSRAHDFNRVLHEAFSISDGVFEMGDSNWHAACVETAATPPPPVTVLPGCRQPVAQPESPSGDVRGAGSPFDRAGAAALGEDVHAALARVTWLDDFDARVLADLPREAGRVVRRFLESPAGTEIFRRPQDPHQLWREKAFDVMLDGRWTSGTFDRVVIYLDAEGQPHRADIMDFKTGKVSTADPWKAQMAHYRRSLAALIGLPADRITVSVVGVRDGRQVVVEF